MLPRRPAREGRPPQRIGKYVVTGRIGRGGMGMVYRGYDEVLEREVAVKTLDRRGHPRRGEPPALRDRGQAAAKLQHPNIVTVFELGEDRGLPFIAMELLPGRRPRDAAALGRAAPPARRSSTIMIQVLPRPALRARARHRAPRHQALQHPAARGRHREDHGLRHRQARRRPGVTKSGHDGGHRPLHEPRADPRAGRSTAAATSSRWASSSTSCSSGARPFAGDERDRRSSTRSSTTRIPALDPDARRRAAPDAAGDPRSRAGQGPGGRATRRGRAWRTSWPRWPRACAARPRRLRRGAGGGQRSRGGCSRRAGSRRAAAAREDAAERHPRSLEARRALRAATPRDGAAPEPREPERRRLPGARRHLPGRADAARAETVAAGRRGAHGARRAPARRRAVVLRAPGRCCGPGGRAPGGVTRRLALARGGRPGGGAACVSARSRRRARLPGRPRHRRRPTAT